MDIRQIAKEFVISFFGIKEDFFNTAWDFINQNYDKMSSRTISRKDLRQLSRPLGIVGEEQQGALLAVLIFVDAVKQVRITGRTQDLIAAIQGASKKYEAQERMTEEILNRIKKFEPEEMVKEPEEEKAEYRVWYKDSEPKGEPLDSKGKEDIVTNPKKYELLIIREETRTQVFIKGEESKRPPGKLAYRILVYVLKNKGAGGTAWDIAQHVWESKYNRPFKDVRETIKSIEMQERIDKARIEQSTEDIERISTLVRRRITDLNKYFLKKLSIKLEAKEMDEYELTTVPKYCLIEKN